MQNKNFLVEIADHAVAASPAIWNIPESKLNYGWNWSV